jgi:hypothetical protein
MVIKTCQSMAHDLFGGSYHPELHYMRGPGPKCREKLHTAELAHQQLPTHSGFTPAEA